MNHQSMQRATACQAGSSSTQAQSPRQFCFYSSDPDQEYCAQSWETLTLSTSGVFICLQLHDATHQSCFPNVFVALQFSQVFWWLLRKKDLDGIPVALKSTSLSRHTSRLSSSTARILTGTLSHTRSVQLVLSFDCCSISLPM